MAALRNERVVKYELMIWWLPNLSTYSIRPKSGLASP